MDDKDEEIARLKAALEAKSAGVVAPAPTPATKAKKKGGVLVPVLLGFGALVVLANLVPDSEDAPSPAPEAPAGPCDQTWAEGFYKEAQAKGVVRDADVSRERGMVVIVSARGWERQSLDAQKTLGAAIDCAVAGPGKHLTGIKFRTSLDGSDLMALSATELLSLRRDGLAKGDS
jgi:hypothetical protein